MGALTTNFYQLLSDNIDARPGKPAIVDGHRAASYSAVAAEVDRVAGYLQSRNIRPGDRVIVHLRKSIAEVVAMFAIAKVGDVIVEFAGQKIANIYDYTYALDAVKIGQQVKMAVEREGKRVELTVTPEARK